VLPGIELIEKLPIGPFVKVRKARARLDRIILRVIAERRANPAAAHDLVSMLLAARDPEHPSEPGMSDQQIRDEAMTIFLAGHETTANAMAWTFHLLATSPEVETKLHQEIEQVLGGRTPAVEDVPRLEYTRAVIAESMRLFPPAWTMGRRVMEPHTIGGYAIEPNALVLMSQWVAHRDPRWWDDPQVFRPERWQRESKRPKYSYFPFGGGTRICIGESFAWTEAILLLATIAQRWRFAPVTAPTPEPRITLRPHHLQMRAARR
jgi:cytochrome P450